jgi:hypothetical protein
VKQNQDTVLCLQHIKNTNDFEQFFICQVQPEKISQGNSVVLGLAPPKTTSRYTKASRLFLKRNTDRLLTCSVLLQPNSQSRRSAPRFMIASLYSYVCKPQHIGGVSPNRRRNFLGFGLTSLFAPRSS